MPIEGKGVIGEKRLHYCFQSLAGIGINFGEKCQATIKAHPSLSRRGVGDETRQDFKHLSQIQIRD